jgi:hypothetical protein
VLPLNKQRIADRYFQHVPGTLDAAHDVVEEVDELVRSNPRAAWRVIRELIDRAPSEEALAYVASGPLETLLSRDSEAVASLIRADAEKNEQIAAALGHVLLIDPPIAVRKELSLWVRPIE